MEEPGVYWGNLEHWWHREARMSRRDLSLAKPPRNRSGNRVPFGPQRGRGQMRIDCVASIFISCPQMLGEATILFSPLDGFSWSDIGVLHCPPLPGVHTQRWLQELPPLWAAQTCPFSSFTLGSPLRHSLATLHFKNYLCLIMKEIKKKAGRGEKLILYYSRGHDSSTGFGHRFSTWTVPHMLNPCSASFSSVARNYSQ